MLILATSPGSSFDAINRCWMTIAPGDQRNVGELYAKGRPSCKGSCCVEHAVDVGTSATCRVARSRATHADRPRHNWPRRPAKPCGAMASTRSSPPVSWKRSSPRSWPLPSPRSLNWKLVPGRSIGSGSSGWNGLKSRGGFGSSSLQRRRSRQPSGGSQSRAGLE